MNNATVDDKSKPADYAEFHRNYFSHIVYLCGVCGIDEDNREDVASDIFVRLFERGFLDFFDADLVFEYEGSRRAARFKTLLSSTVIKYLRGHRDKLRRDAHREPLLCDRTTGQSGTTTGSMGARWADVYGPPHADHADEVIEMVSEESTAAGIRLYLADVPRRSDQDRCDLVALYDAVRTQVLNTGHYDVKILKDIFGVSPTAMHTWIWWLKENLADAYGRPVPAKRPRMPRAAS